MEENDETKISSDLNSLLISLSAIHLKLENLIDEEWSQENIMGSLLNQVAISNSFLIKKGMMDEYYDYTKDMQKQYLDYQILLASYKERNDL